MVQVVEEVQVRNFQEEVGGEVQVHDLQEEVEEVVLHAAGEVVEVVLQGLVVGEEGLHALEVGVEVGVHA